MIHRARIYLAGLATALLFATSVAAQRSPQWLFVPSKTGNYAGLSMQKMASIYLSSATWASREPGEAGTEAATSRFVIGTPTDNATAAKLCAQLGVKVAPKALHFEGRKVPPGHSLMLVADDPDGKGQVVLFTAIDEQSVAAAFSVRFDMTKLGFTIARRGKVVHRGNQLPRALTAYDNERLIIVRLDQTLAHLQRTSTGVSPADVALHVARGMQGYDFVLKAAMGNHTVPHVVYGQMLTDNRKQLAAIREQYRQVDITAEVQRIYDHCKRALHPGPRVAPIVYVMHGLPDGGSNAKNFGVDEASGRRRVLLNLSMLKSRADFEVATYHELTHTFQTFRPRLVDRAIMEGTATLISQLLRDGTEDARALMWTDAQLKAAQTQERALVAAVKQHANALDQRTLGTFLFVDSSLPQVPGDPGRSAYYVGWLAAKAWRTQHPKATLGDLIQAKASDVLGALDD